MIINVITLFPSLILEHLKYLPLKRALEKNIVSVKTINLRDYAVDSYGSVDDKPYGGGTGMILRIEPMYNALRKNNIKKKKRGLIILLSPSGEKFTQTKAHEYSCYNELTFICGRYEGVDARVNNLVDEIISIGDYVLSGGEVPTMAIMESVVRLLPGVLDKEDAIINESFEKYILEHPQYTRPEIFKDMKVPDVLLSGDHSSIEKWKTENQGKSGDFRVQPPIA